VVDIDVTLLVAILVPDLVAAQWLYRFRVSPDRKNRQNVVVRAAALGLAALVAGGVGPGFRADAATKKRPTTVRVLNTTKPTTTKPTTTQPGGSASTLVPVGGAAQYKLTTRTQSFVDSSRGTAKTSASAAVATRTLPTLILTPQAKGKKLPLMVFSHGLGGEPSLYLPLLTALAESGYVVAAPTFPLSNAKAPGGPGIADQPNQPADVSFVITQMLKDKAVDPDRVFAGGHSLGGITTVDLIGHPKLIDKRIDGAVIVAGTTNVFNFVKYFEATPSFPVLFIHGDTDETVPYALGSSTFRQAKAPKWFLTVVGGNHSFGLTGKPDKLPQTAAMYADAMVRFLDATASKADQTAALQKLVDANTTLLKLESVTK
jgi:dienelactone hydrolase